MRKGFKRYQLSYPFEGRKIYETRSLARAAKKGYREFIDGSNGNESLFSIIDIDNLTEYNFRINDKKLYIVDTSDNLISSQESIKETTDDKIIPMFNPPDLLDNIPKLK
jgi:hypothetical protein